MVARRPVNSLSGNPCLIPFFDEPTKVVLKYVPGRQDDATGWCIPDFDQAPCKEASLDYATGRYSCVGVVSNLPPDVDVPYAIGSDDDSLPEAPPVQQDMQAGSVVPQIVNAAVDTLLPPSASSIPDQPLPETATPQTSPGAGETPPPPDPATAQSSWSDEISATHLALGAVAVGFVGLVIYALVKE